jgi:hypothetical protein
MRGRAALSWEGRGKRWANGRGRWVPTERKTGLEPAIRALRVRDGGLDLLRRAA